jgi:hypothetical protein
MSSRSMFRTLLVILMSVNSGSVVFADATSNPQEPGWTRGVILFGEARAEKNATPILERDYRPLHFYGNTARRRYYRGSARPTVSDLRQTVLPAAGSRSK